MLFDAISHGRTLWGQPVEDLDSFIDVMDQNHDGLISRSELLDVLKRLDVGVMESQLERLVHSIDANRDGEIELEEFAAWMRAGGQTPVAEPEETEAQSIEAELTKRLEREEAQTGDITISLKIAVER